MLFANRALMFSEEYKASQQKRAIDLQKLLIKHFRKLEALGTATAELESESPAVRHKKKGMGDF